MPSCARADASTQRLRLLAVDDGLRLPDGIEIVLTIESGPQANKSFPLTKARTVIGRKGSDIALEDPEISRHHCVVEVREGTINLKDLHSPNPTFFQGKPAPPSFLH